MTFGSGWSHKGRAYLKSENPVEEVWAQIARCGTRDFIESTFSTPRVGSEEWVRCTRYAEVRLNQAVEFRSASRHGSPISSPLTLYYSFLNLTRAMTALVSERIPTPTHGLKFESDMSGDLFTAAARIQAGTFLDYLAAIGAPDFKGCRLTLADCIAQIPEMAPDFMLPGQRMTLAVPVEIAGKTIWALTFRFFDGFITPEQFDRCWQSEFPGFAERCARAAGPLVLALSPPHCRTSDLDALLEAHLEEDLEMRSDSVFFALRHTPGCTILPRAARYIMAMFILGSVVRYKPELLSEAAIPGTSTNWLLRRLLQKAERFFPQLMLSWVSGEPVYF